MPKNFMFSSGISGFFVYKHTEMKKIWSLLFLVLFVSCVNKGNREHVYEPIVTMVPERPAGQHDAIGLTCPKMGTVRVGFIGLGGRGRDAVRRFTFLEGVEIKALCDLHKDRVDVCQHMISDAGLPMASTYCDSDTAWMSLCQRKDIDLVYIATDWVNHAPLLIYAMEQGKHVACEVPAALSLDEIWQIVNVAERTRKHCMQLENCVYDFFEITTLNMAQQGLFGEITHVKGAYNHTLEEFWKGYNADWRMKYNIENRGDVYPTHGFGPACQLLNVHRGDKLDYLVSMDSDPVSLPAYLRKQGREEEAVAFQNGEVTLSFIRTQKGKTIHIEHNVASPRPYSRMYQLTGTKGFADKYPVEGYALDSESLPDDIGVKKTFTAHEYMPEEVKAKLSEHYKGRIISELETKAKEVGGHGGMDFVMDYRLIYCLRNGLPLDMDVYDLAEWCSLIPLSKLSLENGSAPVKVPDFTRGSWDKIQGYRHAFVE